MPGALLKSLAGGRGPSLKGLSTIAWGWHGTCLPQVLMPHPRLNSEGVGYTAASVAGDFTRGPLNQTGMMGGVNIIADHHQSAVPGRASPMIASWCPMQPRRMREPRPAPRRQHLQCWAAAGGRQPGVAGAALWQPQAMVEIPCRDCAGRDRSWWPRRSHLPAQPRPIPFPGRTGVDWWGGDRPPPGDSGNGSLRTTALVPTGPSSPAPSATAPRWSLPAGRGCGRNAAARRAARFSP